MQKFQIAVLVNGQRKVAGVEAETREEAVARLRREGYQLAEEPVGEGATAGAALPAAPMGDGGRAGAGRGATPVPAGGGSERSWAVMIVLGIVALSVVGMVLVAGVLVALGFFVRRSSPSNYAVRVVEVYYLDVGEGKVFLAKSNEIPPVAAPSGKLGVRAYVFACGNCPADLAGKSVEEVNGTGAFIGWLESYSTEAQGMLKNPKPIDPNAPPDPTSFEAWERGHLIADEKGETWVQFNSPEGFKVQEQIHRKCGQGKYPNPCYPRPR